MSTSQTKEQQGFHLQDSVFRKLPQKIRLPLTFCKGSANYGLWMKTKENKYI